MTMMCHTIEIVFFSGGWPCLPCRQCPYGRSSTSAVPPDAAAMCSRLSTKRCRRRHDDSTSRNGPNRECCHLVNKLYKIVFGFRKEFGCNLGRNRLSLAYDSVCRASIVSKTNVVANVLGISGPSRSGYRSGNMICSNYKKELST